MLTSFARAVLAPGYGCSCRACSRAASAIPGRTVTRPQRRKMSIADAFTACYTTIMATAAVMDASAKKKRKIELDQRIIDARAQLQLLVEDKTAQEVWKYKKQVNDSSHMAGELDSKPMHAIASICQSRNQMRRTEPVSWEHATFAKRLRGRFNLDRRKDEPLYTDFGKMRTVIALEEDSSLSRREPKTDVHLDRTKGMIKELAAQLLLQAYREDDKIEPGIMQRQLNMLDSAWGYMRMLSYEGYPKFAAVQGEQIAVQVRGDLTAANYRVFDDHWKPGCIRQSVPKICYNLMVSRFPPSIHNYNALIAGFLQKGELGLSEVVVDSFLNDSKFMPTQNTIVLLLNHYSMSNNTLGFYGIIRRIVGLDQRGMRIRQKEIDAVAQKPLLQEWASSPSVTLSGDFFVERTRLDFDIADALINGLLSFGRLEHATKVFLASLHAKIDVDVSTFIALVNHCVSEFHYFALRLILDGMLRNLADTLEMIRSLPGSSAAVRSMGQLLALCYPSHGSRLREFKGYQFHLLYATVKLKRAEAWAERIGRIARTIDRILRASSHTWEHRVAVSCAIFKRHERVARQRKEKAKRAGKVQFLGILEDHCIRLDTKIRETEFEVLAALAEYSPFPIRKSLRYGSHTMDIRLQDHLHARALSTFSVTTQIIGDLVQRAEDKTKTLLREALPSTELMRLSMGATSVYDIPAATLTDGLQRTVYPFVGREHVSKRQQQRNRKDSFLKLADHRRVNGYAATNGREPVSTRQQKRRHKDVFKLAADHLQVDGYAAGAGSLSEV